MKQFSKLLEASSGFAELLTGVRNKRSPQLAAGLTNLHKAHYIYSLCELLGQRAHVVMPNEPAAIKLCEDLNAFFGFQAAWLFPSREFVFRGAEGVSREYEHARLGILGGILRGDCPVVVSSAEGAVQYTIPRGKLRESTVVLTPGEIRSMEELQALLAGAGYEYCGQVEGMAQFSVRGGLLDFFPPSCPQPVRVEFWGDEIDTISSFDPITQRRESILEEATVTPARETLAGEPAKFIALLENLKKNLRGKYGVLARERIDADLARLESGTSLENADKYLPVLYSEPETLFDYCGGRLLFVCEPVAIREQLKAAEFQSHEDVTQLMSEGVLFGAVSKFSADYAGIARRMEAETTVILDTFQRAVPDVSLRELYNIKAVQLSVWSGEYSFLKEDIESFLERDYCVVVFAGTGRACAALAADLSRDGIPAEVVKDFGKPVPGRVCLMEDTLSAGFDYPDIKLALITHTKTAPTVVKRKKKHKDGKKIKAVSDLLPGDYVVHSSHGIGVFEGIVKRDMQGVVKDYIKIRYSGTDMLFVPVTQLDLVTKYIGASEDARVRLNKLNSAEWQKTRARVKGAVKEMAQELIRLYAERSKAEGFAFSPDSDWQREFEERFPFEETDDQLRCAEEIKDDMQRAMPMDRLLCGDVGFGKTEVALRAAFKCVLDGKQCAVLVPTTILAWQHYQTFTGRLEGYPVNVELLSRFKSPKEQKEIIKNIKQGVTDIVIGTNRVVQKDVEFRDLGLCIIDEEQRFGVKHKEKFKELKSNVDVLTLSATPIPRTLNMAMSGIRDMSIIEEAPQDRHPVQTYVIEHDYGVITQAIQKELRRGGQVFYLHNRIDSIDSCAARLKEMLPGARIVTAHGRVGEDTLSEVWRQLVEQGVDILVCTTIIETGVDVPNCNTLIIEDADRMGLSQLYQLRGRVGRSSRRAYAYFTFRRDKALTDVASKRLTAIREFTAFGSGFRIAMRDLEIRGAGNILGAQQHGHLEAVGYDLYLKLLSEAVIEEQGGAQQTPLTDCVIDLRLDAHIPEDYIENLGQRIDIYKKIASITTTDEALDVTDELIDRFGEPPTAVKGLIDVSLVRGMAARLGVIEITQKGEQIIIRPETLDMAAAGNVASKLRGRCMVNAGQKPYFAVKIPPGGDPVDTIREAIAAMAM